MENQIDRDRILADDGLRREFKAWLLDPKHLVAFDRGERTLSLAKAFDILRVVGLVDEPAEDGAQELFVQESFARWRQLTEKLPPDSPGRFPNGWYRIDYALEGDLKDIELHRFENLLGKAVTRHTGWPMFWLPRRVGATR